MLGLNVSLIYYSISFENCICFVSNEDVSGIDFFELVVGGYINDGGIELDGIELVVDYQVIEFFGVYVFYIYNSFEYIDEGLEGVQVIGMLEDMVVISFDYQCDIYSVGLFIKYVGDCFVGLFIVDVYLVSDFYLGVMLE